MLDQDGLELGSLSSTLSWIHNSFEFMLPPKHPMCIKNITTVVKKHFLSHSGDQKNKTARPFHQNLIRTNNHTRERKWHTQRRRSKADSVKCKTSSAYAGVWSPRTGSVFLPSLVVQWLGLSAPIAGGLGSIPSQGTKMPHISQYGQKRISLKIIIQVKVTQSSPTVCDPVDSTDYRILQAKQGWNPHQKAQSYHLIPWIYCP